MKEIVRRVDTFSLILSVIILIEYFKTPMAIIYYTLSSAKINNLNF